MSAIFCCLLPPSEWDDDARRAHSTTQSGGTRMLGAPSTTRSWEICPTTSWERNKRSKHESGCLILAILKFASFVRVCVDGRKTVVVFVCEERFREVT